MMTVSELKTICENIEREYGSDVPVCIQFIDRDDMIHASDYVVDHSIRKDGTLYLSNRK